MKAKIKRLFSIFDDLWTSRKLMGKLAWMDIRKRYAGSIGGIIWAYVVPLINILVMWFVFQYVFGSVGRLGTQMDIPYIVWLVPGYIMWTLISDSLIQATNCMAEYSYLVKKVQFKSDILPPMKVISSLFIHAFFLVFALVICLIFGNQGFWPTWAWFQLFYFLLGAIVLLTGLSWLVASLAVFLKDMNQIVTVVLQIGFWATPVFWNLNDILNTKDGSAPSPRRVFAFYFLQFNPFYYLVNGYRSTMVLNQPFWEFDQAYWQGPYFWAVAIFFLFLGAFAFGKTRKHFADVL